MNSSIAGIIFSRLYIGNYSTKNITQDFTMKYKNGSLADKLFQRNKSMNVFTGTSVAHYTMLKMLSRINTHRPRFFNKIEFLARYPGVYFKNKSIVSQDFYRVLQILHLMDRVTQIPSMKATKWGTMAILRTKRLYSYTNKGSEMF